MSNCKIWHFVDYPTTEDEVLLKTVDGELAICVWNQEHSRWLDLGHDSEWFTAGVACWAYLCDFGIPETTKEMPPAR